MKEKAVDHMGNIEKWVKLSSDEDGIVGQIWKLFEQLGHVFGPLKDLLGLI